MKRIAWAGLAAVAALGITLLACSDDEPAKTPTQSPPTNDGGGTTGSSGGSSSGDDEVAKPKDTCTPAGGQCLCSCKLTGQTEDKDKTCIQPIQGSGACAKVCCTGPVDGG